MDIFKIIDDLQKNDGDAVARLAFSSRRHFMNHVGSKVAAVAIPSIFATIVNKAYGQSAAAVDVLNFALTLEYLEDEFYKAGNAAANLIPASDKAIFTTIGKHETAHVAFLVKALGASAIKKPTFDFTYKGAFADVLTNYKTFVAVSAALEDTGVRAYKGQAGALIADPQILEYANSSPTTKAWITGKQPLIAAVQPIYDGEDNMTQGGVNVKGLASKSDNAVTEAFDEPLTKAAVLAIAGPFIKA
jgi:hypothetical protein